MSALTIEQPEYMRQDDVVILERSIGKFLDEARSGDAGGERARGRNGRARHVARSR